MISELQEKYQSLANSVGSRVAQIDDGDDNWIESTLEKLKECPDSGIPPQPSVNCELRGYVKVHRIM